LKLTLKQANYFREAKRWENCW